MSRWVLALVLSLVAPITLLGQDDVVWSQPERPLIERVLGLQNLDDSARARETKELALQIQTLPPTENKLHLAGALANLANQGDF